MYFFYLDACNQARKHTTKSDTYLLDSCFCLKKYVCCRTQIIDLLDLTNDGNISMKLDMGNSFT